MHWKCKRPAGWIVVTVFSAHHVFLWSKSVIKCFWNVYSFDDVFVIWRQTVKPYCFECSNCFCKRFVEWRVFVCVWVLDFFLKMSHAFREYVYAVEKHTFWVKREFTVTLVLYSKQPYDKKITVLVNVQQLNKQPSHPLHKLTLCYARIFLPICSECWGSQCISQSC